jgi:hypothetical protein
MYWQEKGRWFIPKGPHFYESRKRKIPMEFNCSDIIRGIIVDSVEKPPKEKKVKG